ncbi:MAG: hypothetical protein H8D34_05270 [Chloroflexi bacterium]|nr:hypothetical protein [Chloroflexota bacterium]
MLLLGFLSVLQITLLPGLLILKAFNIKRGTIHKLIFSFALSLITNHLVVFGITAIRINISYTFYAIFAIELILFIKLYAGSLVKSVGSTISTKISTVLEYIHSLKFLQKEASLRNFSQTISEIIGFIFVILAASSIWWAFKVWYTNIDTVFTQWDTIVSWNRWATEWYSGIFPTSTSRYAQLIPTNFAVSYAFLRSTQIQFFAKSIMPLFNLFILLLILDLGLDNKNTGYFIGVVATRYIIKKFLGSYIASGYVDVALAFFTLITVYTLLKAKSTSNPNQKLSYVGLGAIFAAGTALTKQNGLFVFAVYPFLAYWLILRNITSLNRKDQIIKVAKWFGISLCIILPWYIFNETRILMGANETNILYLAVDRHEGRNLAERFIRAMGLLEKYAFLFPFILLLLPFLDSAIIWISLTILIPYTLIWAFAFSTFPRNLSIALPILGLVTGMATQKVIEFGEKLTTKIKIERLKLYIITTSTILGIIIGSLFVSDTILIDHQEEQQKDILLRSINHKIYDYFDDIGHYEPIMTNYPIQYLPGLENMQIDIGNFADYALYHLVIDNHPEARLLLVFEDRADEQVLQEVAEEIEAGNYELIFQDGKYMFIKITR